jgi:hypothetical protein
VGDSQRRLAAAEKRLQRLKVPEQADDFTGYRDDPAGFCLNVLGFQSATRRTTGEPYQFSILRDLAESPRVAVISGHGVGKTTTDAAACLWWLLSHPYSKVIIVAPEFSRQVRGALFGEINKLVRRAKRPLPLEVLAGRVTVLGYGPEWSALGMPATEPDRIEGAHAEGGLLLILDECKGVGQDVFDALQGALTGGDDSRLLVSSTPGGIAGPFYRIIDERGDDWRVHHLSSVDSSRVAPEWCARMARQWGEDSALYTTRVLGEFANHGDGVLFTLSLLEDAVNRPLDLTGADVVMGVDVARSVAGDQNCIAVCRGGKVERLILWRSPDTTITMERVAHEALRTNPRRIRVDEGGVGGGVVDRLRQLRLPVEGVMFGGHATESGRFRNRRAEMFWMLRDALAEGRAALPDDDELLADLTAVRYGFEPSGRIYLEPKDEARKRLGRSPDRADAIAMALGVSPRARGWPMKVVDVDI